MRAVACWVWNAFLAAFCWSWKAFDSAGVACGCDWWNALARSPLLGVECLAAAFSCAWNALRASICCWWKVLLDWASDCMQTACADGAFFGWAAVAGSASVSASSALPSTNVSFRSM